MGEEEEGVRERGAGSWDYREEWAEAVGGPQG